MTNSPTQSSATRLRFAWDRLVWGLADVRRRLARCDLWPEPAVVAQVPGGPLAAVQGGRLLPLTERAAPTALLVPESHTLWGRLQLPDMPRAGLDAAVQEAMWRVSPLPPENIVCAWRVAPEASGGWAVDWGLCPRPVYEQGMAQLGLDERQAAAYLLQPGSQEVFMVHGPASVPIARRRRRWDALVAAGVLLALVCLALPAAMPLVLKRQAVVRAVQHAQTVEPMAAPLREKLDELRQQASVAEELNADRASSLPLASAFDQLAQVLPDGTWLDRLEFNGGQIRIMGLTSNAAELMASLSRHPRLAEVRTTAPTVRDESQNKERFAFEMRWREEDKPS